MDPYSDITSSTKPVILVIDDNVQFVSYLSELLEYEGFRVYKALDGDEGIEVYIQHHPHLIITDIIMPLKEGLGLIMNVREKDQKTPIIAVSGGNYVNGSDYLRMAQTFGANAVLHKPFQSELLLETINKLLTAT